MIATRGIFCEGAASVEYVMLLALVVLTLVGASFLFHAPGTAPFLGSDHACAADFGAVGNTLRDGHEHLVCGIGLPVP